MPATTHSTDRTAHLLALMKQGDDAFNSHDLAAMNAVHHPDMIAHIPGNAEPIHGRTAHAAAMEQFFRIFPGTVITPTGKAFDLEFGQTIKWDGDQVIEIFASGTPLCRHSRPASPSPKESCRLLAPPATTIIEFRIDDADSECKRLKPPVSGIEQVILVAASSRAAVQCLARGVDRAGCAWPAISWRQCLESPRLAGWVIPLLKPMLDRALSEQRVNETARTPRESWRGIADAAAILDAL